MNALLWVAVGALGAIAAAIMGWVGFWLYWFATDWDMRPRSERSGNEWWQIF